MKLKALPFRVGGLIAMLLITVSSTSAQSTTLEQVTALFNSSCSASSCHDASSPAASLNLSGSASDIYNELVNVNPTNPNANGKGWKRVVPGSPETSYLMAKIARASWDSSYPLEVADGNPMPTATDLAPEDIELVRQWIQFGAQETGEVVDPAILSDFYNDAPGTHIAQIEAPPAPAADEGFQIRMGPIFLEPGEEVEYFFKKPVSFNDSIEVSRTHVFFNDESHHFILYKYDDPDDASSYRAGYRELYEPGAAPQTDVTSVAAWQDAYDIPLPEGTSYWWGAEEVLDMNFHLINPYMDQIMPATVYVNIYTQPHLSPSANVQMFSQILPINITEALTGTGFIGQDLIIPGDGSEYTFEDDIWFPFDATWHIWYLSSHTHARGTDYDIYLRDADNTQIFEGFYDVDYTFDQGFYDWEHPPVRFFEPLLEVPMGFPNGIHHEAKYINNTGSTITWGDRTTDEMMLFFIQYTERPLDLTGLDVQEFAGEFTAGPNPFRNASTIRYKLDKAANVQLEVFDAMGRQVALLTNGMMQAGTHQAVFNPDHLSNGLYTVKLSVDGASASHKVMRLN